MKMYDLAVRRAYIIMCLRHVVSAVDMATTCTYSGILIYSVCYLVLVDLLIYNTPCDVSLHQYSIVIATIVP